MQAELNPTLKLKMCDIMFLQEKISTELLVWICFNQLGVKIVYFLYIYSSAEAFA